MPMNSNDIRRTYLDFFKERGHAEVESSPLVPRNDPTMMFTNSGMVQFKNVFTGQDKRPYSRATTAQKCVRAGGKHNDLDNVGYTGRHLTFFEMLGNFSFGDYFKEDAIAFAWELSTKYLQLPKDRIIATVYFEDDEAHGLWKKIAGLSDDRIIRIGDNKGARYASDNFWMMGETGPCGPCSELFFDQGDKVPGGPPGSADEDGDRYLEFWNNVFMQFERDAAGNMTKLPKPSIDTGMGLERINALLNGHTSVWGTDSMRLLIEAAANLTNADPDGDQKFSLRVIADHLRSTSFLVAEGVLPSNEGRGYVLRRIMRRAMRHAHLLGAKDPLMHKLVPTLVSQMGGHYHELERAQALITETLKGEEIRFKATLERGLKLLDEEENKLGSSEALSGEVAFKLYDTYGFPLDLTQDVLRGHNREVDTDGFKAAMERQKAEARKSAFSSGEVATQKVWFELKEEVGPTEFLGYDTLKAEGQVVAILKGETRLTEASAKDGEVALIVNQTPFYGEGGGQVGDIGTIDGAGVQGTVRDVQKPLGVFAHYTTITEGTLKVGAAVRLNVDGANRTAIKSNHSATHLLHEALRRTLGDHVTQKGSEVSDKRLRFDISHPKALSADEIAKVEALVNERIFMNSDVECRIMTPKEAMDYGAMALFGEKYGDEVRVLGMGGVDEGSNKPWSLELCGGIHVNRTGDIGLFKLTADSAVAAGVRRIEGITGAGALSYMQELQQLTNRIGGALNVPPVQAVDRITQLMDERRTMEREIADLRRKLAMGGQGGAAAPTGKLVNGIKLDARVVDLPARDLKPMADDLKRQLGSGIIALISTNDGKLSVVVSVTDDLKDKRSAVDILQAAGLKGGGRADMAQAGGGDAALANEILQKIELSLAG